MALPAFALPMLFAGGSLGLNVLASNKQQGAVNDAYLAERNRQNTLDAEARAINNRARERYTDFEGQQEERKSELADLYTQSMDSEPARPVGATPATSSNVVVNAEAKAGEETRAELDDQAQRRATFRSFGDLFGGITRDGVRDRGDLGMIGGFKRGSQSISGLEMQEAAQAGQGLRNLADLFSLGAGATMPGALVDPTSLAGIFAGGKP